MLLPSSHAFLLEDLRGLGVPAAPGSPDVSTPLPRFCPSPKPCPIASDAILSSALSFPFAADALDGFLAEKSTPFPLVSV
uniref:Uncharacterized protein n=1 Tax=Setaria italica TaxID=4555 RepID=K3XNW5_SETIT